MNKEEIEEIETLEINFKDTDDLELALEVSSKKAIYLIDDLIKYLFELQQENKKYKEVIDKAIEYMKDFIFEPLLTNEDRKLIMYNDNLRNFEKILKEVK